MATPFPALARGGPPGWMLVLFGPRSLYLRNGTLPCPWLLPGQHLLLPQDREGMCLGLFCAVLSLAPFKGCVRNSPPLSGVLTAHLPPSGSAEEAGGDP